MKLKKSLSVALVILFALILSSCGNVQVKNTEWCADIGPLGATCFNTLNDDTRDLDELEWEYERFGYVCTSPDDFAEIRKVIEKLCSSTRRCDFEDQKKIKNFFKKMDDIKERYNL